MKISRFHFSSNPGVFCRRRPLIRSSSPANGTLLPIERLRLAHHNLQYTLLRHEASARKGVHVWLPKFFVGKEKEFQEMLVDLCLYGECQKEDFTALLTLVAFPAARALQDQMLSLRNSLLFAMGGRNLDLQATRKWLGRAKTLMETANYLLNPGTVQRPPDFRDCSLSEIASEIEKVLTCPSPI